MASRPDHALALCSALADSLREPVNPVSETRGSTMNGIRESIDLQRIGEIKY